MELSDVFEKIKNHVKQNHGEFTNSHGELAFTDDFVVVEPEKYTENRLFWSVLFKQYFVETDRGNEDDDLLFFVRVPPSTSSDNLQGDTTNQNQTGGTVSKENNEEPFYVLRKNGPKPLPNEHSVKIDWEKTVYLNIILHEFDYRATVAHCTQRTKTERMRGISRAVTKVFPSPSRQRMDVKGARTEFTYPFIYFSLDDFEDIFQDIVVAGNECVCVELVAIPKDCNGASGGEETSNDKGTGGLEGEDCSAKRGGDKTAVLFQGAVGYDALSAAYNKKQSGLDVLVNRKPVRYLMMRGPQRKGEAQMAISRTDDGSTGVGAMLGDFVNKFSFAKLTGKDDEKAADNGIHFRSYLTYLSLSWDLIIRDLLEIPKRSILDRMKFPVRATEIQEMGKDSAEGCAARGV